MSNISGYRNFYSLEVETVDLFADVSMPGADSPGIILPVAASGTVTLSSATGTVTATINGVASSVTASGGDTATAAALASKINSSAATGVITATSSGAVVAITAVTPGYAGNSITLTSSAGGGSATSSASTLLGGLSGLLPYPENKGISAIYQLPVAGYYFTVLQSTYKKLLKSDIFFQNNTIPSTPLKPYNVVGSTTARSSGFALLSTVVNTDTIVINNITFTCTTANQASNVTFKVGANDYATARNLAATINGVTDLGVPTGFPQIDPTLSATAIELASNGGAVIVKSTQTNVVWSTGGDFTLTPDTQLANGPGIVTVFLSGSTPTDPDVNTTCKMGFTLRNV